MKIYLASSWRNPLQPVMVKILKAWGHEVYDFRNPAPGNHGFHWSEIDPNWQNWTTAEYLKALQHPIAEAGFTVDFDAMKWADAFVLLLPCGRSAHLELGWAVGAGKPSAIFSPDVRLEPELMVKMASIVTDSYADLQLWLKRQDEYQNRVKVHAQMIADIDNCDADD